MSEQADPRRTEFEQRTRALLEGSVGALSARTRSRLTRARYAALEQHQAAPYAAWWRRWLPAGAVSAAVLAVLLLVGQHLAPKPQLASVAGGDDLELLADGDALALAQDLPTQEADFDYEFYDWAVTAAQDEGSAEVGS